MAKKAVSKKKVALGVGLGLAAAAAAGAGYYFYGSKDSAKNRKKASAWAGKLKADVVKKAKRLEKLDQKAIKKIVDESARAYEKMKSIDRADLQGAAMELKSNWMNIQKELAKAGKKEVKVVKKAAKKAVATAKKVAKKAPAKKKRA
jgi:hypothetical protein